MCAYAGIFTMDSSGKCKQVVVCVWSCLYTLGAGRPLSGFETKERSKVAWEIVTLNNARGTCFDFRHSAKRT